MPELFSPYTDICYDTVIACHNDGQPHRICFKTTHAAALKRSTNPKYAGTINVPFLDSVGPIFQEMTGGHFFPNSRGRGFWLSLRTEEEFERTRKWILGMGELVFLRDMLSISIASSPYIEHCSEAQPSGTSITCSAIGDLFHRIKYTNDRSALPHLTEACVQRITSLRFYNSATHICAVPPSPSKTFDLPMTLATQISAQLGICDITSRIRWRANKPPIKGRSFDEKWGALAKIGLDVDVELHGKSVILIDDLYQSGTTIQFVAMNLQQAGADQLFGFSLVKSGRDSDNQPTR